jgi:predicted cupin superfamily sugar epimerase
MAPTAEDVIRMLGLKPHPAEGGYYRETYRSGDALGPGCLPPRYSGERSASTAIYYLITPSSFSSLHRLKTDEVFHFYSGDPVVLLILGPGREGSTVVMGADIGGGQVPQAVVPMSCWQGALLADGGSYALLGTTVAPGFDSADYERGDAEVLAREYPAFRRLIGRLAPRGAGAP